MAALLLASLSTPAFAQDPEPPRIQWRESWAQPAPWDWVAAGVLGASTLALFLATDTDDGYWLRRNRFDEYGVRAMGASSSRARHAADILSDITRGLSLIPPLFVDLGLAGRVDPTIAGRMGGVSVLSLAATTFLMTGAKYLMRRERPLVRDCTDDPDGNYCEGGRRFRSFPSGHAALAFAGASLTCSFHLRMPLYGNRRADIAACGTALAVASLTGILRVVARKHYLSDVLVGALIGVIGGWLLPTALYFGFDRR